MNKIQNNPKHTDRINEDVQRYHDIAVENGMSCPLGRAVRLMSAKLNGSGAGCSREGAWLIDGKNFNMWMKEVGHDTAMAMFEKQRIKVALQSVREATAKDWEVQWLAGHNIKVKYKMLGDSLEGATVLPAVA